MERWGEREEKEKEEKKGKGNGKEARDEVCKVLLPLDCARRTNVGAHEQWPPLDAPGGVYYILIYYILSIYDNNACHREQTHRILCHSCVAVCAHSPHLGKSLAASFVRVAAFAQWYHTPIPISDVQEKAGGGKRGKGRFICLFCWSITLL